MYRTPLKGSSLTTIVSFFCMIILSRGRLTVLFGPTDRMVIYPSPSLFVGNEDRFYITVLDGNHLVIRNSTDQMPYHHDRVVKHHAALYNQKHNRYVSLHAGNQKTVLITKPLTFDGKVLQPKVEANRGLLRMSI